MTARPLDSATSAEIVKAAVDPFFLFKARLADLSYVRYWSGYGDLSWDSQTWTGAGHLIGIGAIDESADVKAQSATVQVNGLNPATVAQFLAALAPGRQGSLWLGFLNSSGAVIDDPILLFRGQLDGAGLKKGLNDVVATLTYQHRLADLERPRLWMWTDADQKKLYPGDRGLEHIAKLQDAEIPWGNEHRQQS